MAYTFLRPPFFLQNLLPFATIIAERGVLPSRMDPATMIAMVDSRDVDAAGRLVWLDRIVGKDLPHCTSPSKRFGRVGWHSLRAENGPKTGQMRPGSVVRCHLRPPLHLVGGGRNPLLRFGGGGFGGVS